MRHEYKSIDSNYARLREILSDTVDTVKVNTVMFFPSYQFMDRMLVDSVAIDLGRDIYYERKDMPQKKLMKVLTASGPQRAVCCSASRAEGSVRVGHPGQESEAGNPDRDPVPQAHR